MSELNMPPDGTSLSASLYPPPSAVIDPSAVAVSAEAVFKQTGRERRVISFAVRRFVRALFSQRGVLLLQRCAGIALSMLAWMIMLLGLAHLFVAAVHNQEGELGRGLDMTLTGARLCGGSLLMSGLGIPLWVMAERRLRLKGEVEDQAVPAF